MQWKKKYRTDGNNYFNWHKKHREEARNSYFTLQTNPLRKHSFINKPPCARENSFQLTNLGKNTTAKHKHSIACCTSEKLRRVKNRIGIKQTQLPSQRWILPIILSNLMLNSLAISPSTVQQFPNGFVGSHSLQHSNCQVFHPAKVLQSTTPAPLTFWTAYQPYQWTEMKEHQGRASPHSSHMFNSSLNSAEHLHPAARQTPFLTNLCPWISSVSAPPRDPRTAV